MTPTSWVYQLLAGLFAMGAAFMFTTGLALQQRAHLEELRADREVASGVAAAASVLRHPMWVGGLLVSTAGFAMQGISVRLGALVLVAPVMTIQIVFMVPWSAWVVGARVQRREWPPALAVLAGVALFVICFEPIPGSATGDVGLWLLTATGAAGVLCVLFGAGRQFPSYRAALYGFGAGTWTALGGALLKQAAGTGLSPTNWAVYVTIVAGGLNLLLLNVAVRAGRLSSAQTTIAASGAVVSLVIGIVVFGESLVLDPIRVVGGLGAVVLGGWGISRLARSPSLIALDETEAPSVAPPVGRERVVRGR